MLMEMIQKGEKYGRNRSEREDLMAGAKPWVRNRDGCSSHVEELVLGRRTHSLFISSGKKRQNHEYKCRKVDRYGSG